MEVYILYQGIREALLHRDILDVLGDSPLFFLISDIVVVPTDEVEIKRSCHIESTLFVDVWNLLRRIK
jgi:hypothetical protein